MEATYSSTSIPKEPGNTNNGNGNGSDTDRPFCNQEVIREQLFKQRPILKSGFVKRMDMRMILDMRLGGGGVEIQETTGGVDIYRTATEFSPSIEGQNGRHQNKEPTIKGTEADYACSPAQVYTWNYEA